MCFLSWWHNSVHGGATNDRHRNQAKLECSLRYRGLVAGARALIALAGTAMMGIVLAEERAFAPAVAMPSPARPVAALHARAAHVATAPSALRGFAARRFAIPALIILGAIAFAAMVPALGALASGLSSSSVSSTSTAGPPVELRASSGVGSNWEDSVRMSQPAAGDLGAAFIAGREDQQYQDLVHALQTLNQERIDAENAVYGRARAAAAPSPGIPHTLSSASGYAPGTVIAGARITIYGCVGPGGGFCGGMSGGGPVFEGAAACSYNLPFGTKFTIEGDPTGRVYECLDRGALPTTWVDIFFYDTTDGFAWATQLGATRAAITIVN